MKNIFVVILLMALLSSCAERIDKPLEVSIKITDKDENFITHENDTITIYFCEITLENKTDSLFAFWTMDCSYWNQFTFRPDSLIEFYIVGCDGNYSKEVKLLSNEKYVFKDVLRVIDYEKICKEKIQIGFILDERYDRNKRENNLQQPDTIWSKEYLKYDWCGNAPDRGNVQNRELSK